MAVSAAATEVPTISVWGVEITVDLQAVRTKRKVSKLRVLKRLRIVIF
jgi:hypothetical protein